MADGTRETQTVGKETEEATATEETSKTSERRLADILDLDTSLLCIPGSRKQERRSRAGWDEV